MSTYKLSTRYEKRLADTLTPVGIYQRLRDHFAFSFLLESADYHGNENSLSYICVDPIARFELEFGKAKMSFPDGADLVMRVDPEISATFLLQQFIQSFEVDETDLPFPCNGLFGYHSYDAVRYYEDLPIQIAESQDRKIPEMLYQVFRFVIVINHFNNELFLIEHSLGDKSGHQPAQTLEYLKSLLHRQTSGQYDFSTVGEEGTNITDADFSALLQKGKDHCQQGDVFQIVLSRQYFQDFQGDEFEVYRYLRSINPSPYLFYCDYGDFKLFGSSPEAQLVIKEGKATIHPIAGTFLRTGDDKKDQRIAEALLVDPKENAEHVMLVDLARNDLSRNGSEVEVETYKEVQYYSHVIHLVSKVSAKLADDIFSLNLVADTFPAGTLSGAPKHRAIQLINRYENQNRGFYGGCIGMIGFDQSFNHAIIIRSFMSKNQRLYYQAGAGIVAKSYVESEVQEVENKLAALRKALKAAEKPRLTPIVSQNESFSNTPQPVPAP